LSLTGAAVLQFALIGCESTPPQLTPEQELIVEGREIFFNETFDGNGRTCGTCHRAENNLTIDAAFIATLPEDDALFVVEFQPDLGANFENLRLMHQFSLSLENLDGFSDLENVFTQRGVPHTLGLRASVDSPEGPRTGWSGDGAPLDGSLRAFSVGAVIQHFTLTFFEIEDAVMVLEGAGLHPEAVAHLDRAGRFADKARRSIFRKKRLAEQALRAFENAEEQLTNS
jgi:hypothetical protein